MKMLYLYRLCILNKLYLIDELSNLNSMDGVDINKLSLLVTQLCILKLNSMSVCM